MAGGAVAAVTFEQIAGFGPLCRAARAAARGKRLGAQACGFLVELEREALALERELRDGSYRPQRYRTFRIRDPKPRIISAAAFRDRVVHHALCHALTPLLEGVAHPASFACRVGKGQQASMAHVLACSQRFGWALKLDVEHFFETMDHEVLGERLDELDMDPQVRALAQRFIDAGAPGSPPGKGQPIGNLTSQHFANLYLGALDDWATEVLGAPGYARYMDDIVLFADSKHALRALEREVASFVHTQLRLRLKDSATRCGPTYLGVPWLGWRICPALIRLDHARRRRLGRKLAALLRLSLIDEDDAQRRVQSVLAWASLGHTHALRVKMLEGLHHTPDAPHL
jgi:hypothetical protein